MMDRASLLMGVDLVTKWFEARRSTGILSQTNLSLLL